MKTQKIVLALALAVTPVVVVAQQNDNAYNNQNNKEVIVAQNTKIETAFFGSEGKMLSVSELTLAKIKARRAANKKEKKETPRVAANDTYTNPHNSYYVYSGREGHMMALENLSKKPSKRDIVKEEKRDTVPTYIKEADTISRNHQTTLIGDNNSIKKSIKQRNNTFSYYVKLVGKTIIEEAKQEK